MATETTNYKLIKPDEGEFYDIQVFNQNADKIDKTIKDMEGKIPTNLPPDLSGDIKKINENLAKKLNKRTTISTTIPASGWTGASAPYTVNITVTQLTGAADEGLRSAYSHLGAEDRMERGWHCFRRQPKRRVNS